ncbi:hypothetical protein OIU78_028516 [Salix suchowensis]|nr:hypothetical protein OIU78_028516 [Salix suchowensis]
MALATLTRQPATEQRFTGFEYVPANSEAALMKAVTRQPVSVSMDAGGFDFQLYSSGIFAGSCDTQLDHGVAALVMESAWIQVLAREELMGCTVGGRGIHLNAERYICKGRTMRHSHASLIPHCLIRCSNT